MVANHLQSESHQVVLSRELQQSLVLDSCRRSHHPNSNSWGRVEEVGSVVCCRENAARNPVDSPSFGAIINKIPATITAVLGVTVKHALPMT